MNAARRVRVNVTIALVIAQWAVADQLEKSRVTVALDSQNWAKLLELHSIRASSAVVG